MGFGCKTKMSKATSGIIDSLSKATKHTLFYIIDFSSILRASPYELLKKHRDLIAKIMLLNACQLHLKASTVV